ncbi:MAG: Rrf2 family transcriptional regulator [Candidatus Omnitrophota bacterium]|nr:Rrf2 family transcriptional regulator [Candidatus Omnitrophota bacterium]
MKLISRNTDYAIRALCYMAAREKDTLSVTELVEALRIPRPFLRKILQALNKKGILKSRKGMDGGFSLARKSDKIYLVDLIEAFQGPLKLNECLFKKKVCPDRNSCWLKSKIDSIERYVVSELKPVSIKTILKGS